ncbi:MAG: bis(5'-nucleosyl)-tetraphosphatase (symmetrical) YqeK [Chloroflexota bacterium]
MPDSKVEGNATLTKEPYATYLSFLERVLTPPRLRHSLGVMQVMVELAQVYALDAEQARTAGLLHDAAKDLPEAQWAQLVQEGEIELRCAEDQDYVFYLHGPVGAYFVRKELGVDDPLVQDAIAMHTYYGQGENWNHPLVWCLRFSDILEPNRDWREIPWLRQGAPRLRQLAYSGKLLEAAHLQASIVIEWFDTEHKPVHPHMRRFHEDHKEI